MVYDGTEICITLATNLDIRSVNVEHRIALLAKGLNDRDEITIKNESYDDKTATVEVCGTKQELDWLADSFSELSSMLNDRYRKMAFAYSQKIWDKVLTKRQRRGFD